MTNALSAIRSNILLVGVAMAFIVQVAVAYVDQHVPVVAERVHIVASTQAR